MKKELINLRKTFVKLKMYAHRSMSYLSIINASMLLFLTMSKLEDFGFEINITKLFFPLVMIGLIGLIGVGWLDVKFGFFNEETRAIQKQNPDLQKILKIVETLKKK